MKSIVWLKFGARNSGRSLVHAFVVTNDVRAPRTLCNNYPGDESTVRAGDPVLGDRCSTCDGNMRYRAHKPKDDPTVYVPWHKFEEWATAC